MTPLSKRLIIALVVSGALNLLAFGLFIGGAIRRARTHDARARVEHRERPERRDGARDGKREDGPREERGERGERGDGARDGKRRRGDRPLARLFADQPEVMVTRHRVTAAARKAVGDALEREPFDAAAREGALGTLRAETAATQALLHQRVLDEAKKGDAERRKALATGFERFSGGPGF